MPSAPTNRQIRLVRRPDGIPRDGDFALVPAPIPAVGAGEFLIRADYLSADPLQRWRMAETAGYGATIDLGTTVWGRAVGRVVASRNEAWPEGTVVEGMLGWQEYAISRGDTERRAYAAGVRRVDPARAPISTALGVLGMPGLTAYFALLEILHPRADETVVVSAAAGTVGALAGQLAKLRGCRVVGIAGSAEKADHVVRELGFDACVVHRGCPDLAHALREHCPQGVDGYFDNVGGPVADAVLGMLRPHARVALVGRVAQLGGGGAAPRPDMQAALISARARLEGFIVYDWVDRAEAAWREIAAAIAAGRIRYRETVHEGIELAPSALARVLRGEGLGKHVIRIETRRTET